MDVRTIIQKLGGPSAAARFFECRPAAVSQWKRENKIPNARLLHLKAARPELFEPLEIDHPAPAGTESSQSAPMDEIA